jgi:hypothetical protein
MKSLIGLILACWVSVSWADWPVLPVPKGAKVEAVGENVRLNGVPMRMHRVLSANSPKSVLSFYRDALSGEITETRVSSQYGRGLKTHILSQLKDGYFISVRVTKVGPKVTEALLAISDGRKSKSTRGLPLGFALPADSNLLSDMESVDAGKNSRQLVFNNQHSIEANKNFVIDVLQSKGYKLQPQYTRKSTGALSMMFEGRSREAMVVVNKVSEMETSVMMTTIWSLEE